MDKMMPRAIRCEGGAWRVGGDTWTLYEPMFTERAAERVAQLEREGSTMDWLSTKAVLESEGFDDSTIFA